MCDVSVCLTTYNHEKFIGQALDSVLSQKTSFSFEILVGDDGSNDGTWEIISGFARRHRDLFRVFRHERDHASDSGSMGFDSARRNYVNNITKARGRYVAHLDGDDYWCNDEKLEKQVEYLNSRPNLSACFGHSRIVDGNGEMTDHLLCPSSGKDIFSLNDLLINNSVNSPSFLFRRAALEVLPDWFYSMPGVFWPTVVLCGLQGDIAVIPQEMACYRVHGEAVHSGLSKLRKAELSLEGRVKLRGEIGQEYARNLELSVDRFSHLVQSERLRLASSRSVFWGAKQFMRKLSRVGYGMLGK